MRSASVRLLGLASGFCLAMVAGNPANAQLADTNSPAPTGNFVAIQAPFPIALKLETNGAYEVRFGSLSKEQARLTDETQRGTWVWNSRRREILLTPGPNNLNTNSHGGGPDFRHLRIDPQDSQRLQWIPGAAGSFGGGSGVIDYVTFKPKKD